MSDVPIRPKNHSIADLGVSHVAAVFHSWGWISNRIASDYGEDLDCTIFLDTRRTNLHFRCQVKSFIEYSKVRRLNSGDYSISIKTTTAKSWVLSYYPIFLILYNVKNEEIYWINASDFIQKNMDKLSQRTMTIRLKGSSLLKDDQYNFEREVQNFYEQLLKISKPFYESTIYPILMPDYRSLSIFDISDYLQSVKEDRLNFTPEISFIENLPAWSTSINTLMPEQLHGVKTHANAESIDEYISLIETFLEKLNIPREADEWMSFLCSPISLKSQDSSDYERTYPIWMREITGWWCYSIIDDILVSDEEYNFAAPNTMLVPYARHGRSWDNYYYLDINDDVAVEFFSSFATTQSYKLGISILRNHFLSQFIPWICPTEKMSSLKDLLTPHELIFSIIDDFSTDNEKGGIISTPFFNPISGTYSMARNWKDYQTNTVINRLKTGSIYGELPGKYGPEEIVSYILNFVEDFKEPLNSVFINKPQYTKAIPLLHNERIISIDRFQCTSDIEEKEVLEELKKSCADIAATVKNKSFVNYDFMIIDEYKNNPVYKISINWRPDLKDSSIISLNKYRKMITSTFNNIMSSTNGDEKVLLNTYDVIHLLGVIHYKPDTLDKIPWVYGVVGDKVVSLSSKFPKTDE